MKSGLRRSHLARAMAIKAGLGMRPWLPVSAAHIAGLMALLVLPGAGPQDGKAAQAKLPGAPGLSAPSRIEQFAPTEEFVMVGPVKTHFVARGEKGLPIILVHGFGSSTYSWRRNLDALGKRHRVYALDLKGFGLTAKPRDGQYHPAAYAEHLLAFMDTMKLDKAVLVGNSMGGAVAARLALSHPERVLGLVLVDPAPISFGIGGPAGPRPGRSPATPAAGKAESSPLAPKESGSTARAQSSPFRAMAGRLVPAMARSMITRPLVESWLKAAYHDPSLVTPEMVEVYYRPITIDGAAEAMAAMTNPTQQAGPKVPPLETLNIPTIILWGEHDRIVPIEVAEDYLKTIKGSRLIRFERSGHMPHEEEPERFHRELSAFVDRLH